MSVAVESRPARVESRPAPDRFRLETGVVAALVPLTLVGIVVVLVVAAAPSIARFGPGFLVARAWNPVTQQFGALPFVYGTVVTSFIALLLAVPVGVGCAIFLAEPRLAAVRSVIGTGVELLAAIPSVVYGLWGLYVFGPWVFLHIERPLEQHWGWIPVFAGPARQTSMLTASLVVAVMVLPTIAAVSRDVVRAVPGGLREASYALGATWWETQWRVVLPAARAGIFGAGVLALGRALGETIAVTMVIGNRPDILPSVLQPAYTIASVIANEFTEATGKVYPGALIELGLILMLVTLLVNLFALLLVRSIER